MMLSNHELIAEVFERNLQIAKRMVVAHLSDASMQLDWAFNKAVGDMLIPTSQPLQQGVPYSDGEGMSLSRVSEASYIGRRRKVATFIDEFTLGGLANFDDLPFEDVTAHRTRTLRAGGFRTPRSFRDYSVGVSANYPDKRTVAFDVVRDTRDEPMYIVRVGNGRSTEQLSRDEIFNEHGVPQVEMKDVLQDLNFAARIVRIGVEHINFLNPEDPDASVQHVSSSISREDPYPILDGPGQRFKDGFLRLPTLGSTVLKRTSIYLAGN